MGIIKHFKDDFYYPDYEPIVKHFVDENKDMSITDEIFWEKYNKEKAIYKFHLDCGRMGYLEGIFIARKNLINYLIDNSPEIYFGELLGKHSEIISDDYTIQFVTDDPSVVELFKKYKLETGINPLDYSIEDYEVRDYIIEQLRNETRN